MKEMSALRLRKGWAIYLMNGKLLGVDVVEIGIGVLILYVYIYIIYYPRWGDETGVCVAIFVL